MENFWKWLMRANARAVFLGSIVALVCVGAWWTWKELSPVAYRFPPPPPGSVAPPPAGLGVMAYLEQQAALAAAAPPDPFRLPTPPARPAVAPRRDGDVARPTAPSPAPPEQPRADDAARPHRTPVATAPAQPARAKSGSVALTYRGLFRRPDGRVVALIEDSKSRSSEFYAAGDALFGVQVGDIAEDHAEMIRADGSSVDLQLGEPASFREDGNGR